MFVAIRESRHLVAVSAGFTKVTDIVRLAAMYRDGRRVNTKTSLCTFALEHSHYLTKVNLIAVHWVEPHILTSRNGNVPSAIDA